MNFKIQAIPAFKDNYLWLIIHPDLSEALVVDPGDSKPVLEALDSQGLSLAGILITHKHNDHIGGIQELLKKFKVPVFASPVENIPWMTHPVSEQEEIHIKHWPTIKIIEVPGHTLGHVAYLIGSHLFCGDTLFGAGCGRLFEGTPVQMYKSLSKIKSLPENTLIYCAHEYTLKNLSFAEFLEPENIQIKSRIRETEELLAKGIPSVPFSLKIEKETNPFLRCDQRAIKAAVEKKFGPKCESEIDIFRSLRAWRNEW